MKIAINSGLGDMVWFLPFAVELSKKQPFEIVGNKYSAEICAMAGLTNVMHDTVHTVLNPPEGAAVARIKRYGEKNYREIYAEATGCAGSKRDARAAIGMLVEMPSPKKILFVDGPRPSGLGKTNYTPDPQQFIAELDPFIEHFHVIGGIPQMPSLSDLFQLMRHVTAGFGQIGFFTALCNLFDRPFHAVRAAGEPLDKFEARKRVVCL